MAGRIRSLKPEILEDEKTAALSNLEWRLFVSLFLIADDFGNLRGDPAYVHGQVLWATGESRDSVANALEGLAVVSLLSHYTVRGQSYYHISGWDKHQRVDKPGKPRMPGPMAADPEPDETVALNSRDPRGELLGAPVVPAPDLRSTTTERSDGETVAARASGPSARVTEIAELAISEINRIGRHRYDPRSESSIQLARKLAKAKRTDDQILLVIRSKQNWVGDPKMGQYFKPATLLGPENFPKYLDEATGHCGNGRGGPRLVIASDSDEPDLSYTGLGGAKP